MIRVALTVVVLAALAGCASAWWHCDVVPAALGAAHTVGIVSDEEMGPWLDEMVLGCARAVWGEQASRMGSNAGQSLCHVDLCTEIRIPGCWPGLADE